MGSSKSKMEETAQYFEKRFLKTDLRIALPFQKFSRVKWFLPASGTVRQDIFDENSCSRWKVFFQGI
jgi:hypothetical protein